MQQGKETEGSSALFVLTKNALIGLIRLINRSKTICRIQDAQSHEK